MSLERVPRQLSDALMGHAGGRRRPLRRCHSLLSLPLQASLLVVLPLAAARLPDPLWIPAIYDGGDCDDLIAQSSDFTSPDSWLAPVVELPVGLVIVGEVVPSLDVSVSSWVCRPTHARSPPTGCPT